MNRFIFGIKEKKKTMYNTIYDNNETARWKNICTKYPQYVITSKYLHCYTLTNLKIVWYKVNVKDLHYDGVIIYMHCNEDLFHCIILLFGKVNCCLLACKYF